MGDSEFDGCLKDQAALDKVLAQRLEAEKTYKIQSTPTLLVQGDRYSGALRFEELKRLLDSMLPKT